MTKAELKKLIQECVREELKSGTVGTSIIKKYVQMYTPIIVKEIVEDSLDETLTALNEQKKVTRRKNLTEASETFETLAFDSGDTDLLTHRSMARTTPTNMKNIITAIPAGGMGPVGSGTDLIPVDQSRVPDYIKKAMNRNYRDFMSSIPGPRGLGAGSVTVDSVMGLGLDTDN